MASFRGAVRVGVFGEPFLRPTRRRAGDRSLLTDAAVEGLEDRTLLTNYIVNTANDSLTISNNGQLTLREAIQAANTNTIAGDAPAGSAAVTDTITFAAGLAGQTITLAGVELVVSGNLNVTGLGANQLTISGNNVSRVFNVSASVTVTLAGLTVTGGNSTSVGGGILNAGTLAITSSAVVANTAQGNGGGIQSANGSTLNVQDSTIAGNTSAAGIGGGIKASSALSVSNSTISGNSSAADGGGIAAEGTSTLRNVTIFGNRADSDGNGSGDSGGIRVSSNSFTIHNSLVAGNLRGAGAGTADDARSFGGLAFAAASSHNLIGDAGSADGLTDGTNGNIVGASLAGLIDPVLRDNGGPTKTHALLPTSEAINAGDNAQALEANGIILLIFDQRRVPFGRYRQGPVDIGAFEAAPAADVVGFINGQWWAGSSTGTNFTTALWATVPNAAYDALGEADFTGDGKVDAFTLLDGAWRVGTSTGATFDFAAWGGWANADWQDVKAADLNHDGKADIVARLGGQWWGALTNPTGTAFLAPTLWTTWVVLPWREFFLTDVTNDQKADLVGYQHGQWWMGASNGTAFVAPKLVITWADLPWQKLLIRNVEANAQADLIGFLSGEWWVSRSSGVGTTAAAETPVLGVKWANVPFADVLTGDFNGDGIGDVIGRNGGNWFVSLSLGLTVAAFAAPKLYATWSNLDWKDVRAADFDGDGREDVTGRFNGQWWVAESNGAGGAIATTTLWATWAELAWKAIGAVDATGPPAAAGSGSGGAFAPGASSGGSAALFASGLDDEPLAVFWSRVKEDDEVASGLLTVA